jgi:hypothetical protein
MKRYWWLGLFWPALLLGLPSVYDEPVREFRTIGKESQTIVSESDTTYGDDRYVALVPGVWSVSTGDSAFVPDPDSTGAAVAYYAARDPSGDSFLVISYDTMVAAALDSAAVDSIWSAWQLGTPFAYVVDVPGTPSEAGIDTAGSWVHMDFSEYTSTADFWSDPGNKWGADFASYQDHLILDSSFAYPGLTNSMRITYDYPDSASFCDAISAGRGLIIPSYDSLASRPVREYWFEVGLYVPTTTVGCPPPVGNLDCVALGRASQTCAWKTQMVPVNRGSGYGRYLNTAWNTGGTNPTGAGWRMEYAGATFGTGWGIDGYGPTGDSSDFQSINHGQWIKFRQHIKMSSDSLVEDGYSLSWVNDRLIGPSYEDGMDGGFTGRPDGDTLHASPTWRLLDGATEGIGPYQLFWGRNKDKGGHYAPQPYSQYTTLNPWVENAWVGYMTVWTNPDTPSWYPNIEKPAYVP